MKIKNLIILVLAVIVGFIIMFFIGKFSDSNLFSKKTESTHMNLSSRIQNVAEFTTSKVEYCDVVAVKAEIMGGFSKAYNIVKFYGVIRVGVENASEITVSLENGRTKALLRVPHCKVLGNDITQLESFDEKRGLFVAVDTQMVFDKLNDAKNLTQQNLINKGILQEADTRMEDLLKAFVKEMGYEDVEIIWND